MASLIIGRFVYYRGGRLDKVADSLIIMGDCPKMATIITHPGREVTGARVGHVASWPASGIADLALHMNRMNESELNDYDGVDVPIAAISERDISVVLPAVRDRTGRCTLSRRGDGPRQA